MRTLSTLAEIMDLVMNLINWTHNFCEMRKYVFNIFLEYNIITRKTLPFRCHHKYFLLAIILPPKKKKKNYSTMKTLKWITVLFLFIYYNIKLKLFDF